MLINSPTGCYIGYLGVLACADDLILVASSLEELDRNRTG